MPAGRPVEYTPEFTMNAKLYLASCVDSIEEFHKTRGDASDTYERHVKVKLPSIEGLAVYLKIHKDTIYEWEKIHPEFSDVLNDLRHQQADKLIVNGLSGDYNPTIAKLLLAKHGYVEKSELTGAEGKALFPKPIMDLSEPVKTADNAADAQKQIAAVITAPAHVPENDGNQSGNSADEED